MRFSPKRKRVAVSELIGTLVMVAITLVAGAAAFGYIENQAKVSEGAYGQSVANNVNYLRESFVVVSQTFSGTGAGNHCAGGTPPNLQCTGAGFWLFNNGEIGFTLYSIQIKSTPLNPNLNIIFYSVCTVTSQYCGFYSYNSAGTLICSSQAVLPTLNGFYQSTGPSTFFAPLVLSQSQLSTNAYQITMPTGSTCSAGAQYLLDGLAYIVTFTGLYGNTFQTTLTVEG